LKQDEGEERRTVKEEEKKKQMKETNKWKNQIIM
jgi:hypothetical protein